MNAVLYPACGLVAVLALAFKVRLLPVSRSPAQLALIGHFFVLSLTMAISTPSIWVVVSEAAGITNLSGLLSQSLVILMSCCQQLVMLHLSYETPVAWRKAVPRLAALVLALTGMAGLFFLAVGNAIEQPTNFAVEKAQSAPAYLSLYLIAYAANQIDVGLLSWRYAAIAPAPWLRRGLVLIAVATPFALVYVGCRLAGIIAGAFGVSGQAWEPIAPVAVATATVIQTTGFTLPDWGRYLTRAWQPVDRLIAYFELARLHRELTAYVPQVVLELDSDSDLRTRLYRLVVEIRDAQWLLRHWMDPSIGEAARARAIAAELDEQAIATAAEAALLKVALDAVARDARPVRHADSPLVAQPEDLASDVAFLRRLARAYRRCPQVSATPPRDLFSALRS